MSSNSDHNFAHTFCIVRKMIIFLLVVDYIKRCSYGCSPICCKSIIYKIMLRIVNGLSRNFRSVCIDTYNGQVRANRAACVCFAHLFFFCHNMLYISFSVIFRHNKTYTKYRDQHQGCNRYSYYFIFQPPAPPFAVS